MSSESSQSLDSPASEAVMTRLLELENRTGYRMQQCNGQRKYWNPNWTGSPPSRGSEVFVGKIPRDLFEDELVPVFEKVGKIYELRLMMDFSGYNRGYAFVTYTNKEDALRAIELLDNYEVRPGMKIGVCRSVDNCRLFVGSLPKDKSQEEIRQAMSEVTDDVSDVIIYPGNNPGEKNRGFAFVEYTSHRAAAMARRKLIPGRITLFGYEVAVDWADPESDVSMEMMNRVKNVYVRNLKPSTTEFTVWMKFNDIRRGAIEKVKKIEDRDFAFVHFYKREDALYAVQMMNGQIIDGQEIHVSLAKPNAMTKQSLGNKTMFGGLQQQNNGSNYDSTMCGTSMSITRPPPPQPNNYSMTGNTNYSMTNISTSQETPSCTLRGFYNRPKSATPTLGMGEFTRRIYAPNPQSMNMSNGLNLQMPLNLKPVITMDHIADIKCPVTLLGELYERMNYGCPPPHYILYFDDRSGNKDLVGNEKYKYIYRIDFLGNTYVPPCLSDTVEKAKECAAQYVLDQMDTLLWAKLNAYAKRPSTSLVNAIPQKTMRAASNPNAPLFTPINHKAHPGAELISDNTSITSPWFSSWGTSENPSRNMPFLNSMQSQVGSNNTGFGMEH